MEPSGGYYAHFKFFTLVSLTIRLTLKAKKKVITKSVIAFASSLVTSFEACKMINEDAGRSDVEKHHKLRVALDFFKGDGKDLL